MNDFLTNDFVSWIIEERIQIIVATFMVVMFVYGYYRGLVKMSVRIATLIVTVILTKTVLPVIKDWMMNSTVIHGAIQKRVQSIIAGGIQDTSQGTVYSGGGINSIPVPSSGVGDSANVGSDILSKNTDLFFKMIGLDKVTDYLADKISNIIISVILFIVIYIVMIIVVKLLFRLLGLLVQLPGLSTINRLAGGLLGLIEGLCYIWIMLLLIGILPEMSLTKEVGEAFDNQGSYLYMLKQANIFSHILLAVISA